MDKQHPLTTEVHDILQSTEGPGFEPGSALHQSPLAQPVIEEGVGLAPGSTTPPVREEAASPASGEATEAASPPPTFKHNPEDTVPEQSLGGGSFEPPPEWNGDMEIPAGHARQAADTLLGITDNMLELGSGFFVKIKKHQEFYDFEEILQVVEEQNEKNLRRMRLDDEDKALLRPLLILILKKRAKQLTPEQQLMGAVLSILMKKARIMMEVRTENELLTERILDIIREERADGSPKQEAPADDTDPPEDPEPAEPPRPEERETGLDPLTENLLEVADDEEPPENKPDDAEERT